MNVAVISAEVVFKPIKIIVASAPERRKVVYDIGADYKEEESGQAGRYSVSSRQSVLEKLLFLDKKEQRIGLHQETKRKKEEKRQKISLNLDFHFEQN